MYMSEHSSFFEMFTQNYKFIQYYIKNELKSLDLKTNTQGLTRIRFKPGRGLVKMVGTAIATWTRIVTRTEIVLPLTVLFRFFNLPSWGTG